MRKLSAILLICVLLMNWFGYRVIATYCANRTILKLQVDLDNNQYNEADLVTFKIPTHLTYYSNNPDFERVDGEIQLNGITYQYVSKRLYNDSVEFRCIYNPEKRQIEQIKESFINLAFEQHQVPLNTKHNSVPSGLVKDLISEYFDNRDTFLFPIFNCPANFLNSTVNYYLPTCHIPVAEQPPDLV